MTDAIWIAFFASLPGIVVGLGTIFQVRRVHVLVNSQKDALTKLLREALTDNEVLTDQMTDQRATIVLLRQRLDARPAPAPEPPHA